MAFSLKITTASAASENTYYISNSSGDNSLDGKTEKTAWKNFDNLKNKVLLPNEKVLLKRGDVWNERMEILATGEENANVIIDCYGDKTLLKPTISLNNGEDDIAILLKDFYGEVGQKPTIVPLKYLQIKNLRITNARLGIFARLYATSNSGESKNLKISDCEFSNIDAPSMLEEMNKLVEAEEAKFTEFSVEAQAKIGAAIGAKISELLNKPKGNLPIISKMYSGNKNGEDGTIQAVGGGGREYIFSSAIMVGGRKQNVTATGATSIENSKPAFTNLSVENCSMAESSAGVMSWFYAYNYTSGKGSWRSSLKNVNIENVNITGAINGGLALECVDGGGVYNSATNSVSQSKDGYGLIKNFRVLSGSHLPYHTFPNGTTGVIFEDVTNFRITNSEFSGITNQGNADGCGFDFESNVENVEIDNSVFQNNEGGAILIMDNANGKGAHKNLFIHDNLMYNNLQNAFSASNNRNNNIESKYVHQYNGGNENVVFENNSLYMQRVQKGGEKVLPYGPNQPSDSTFYWRDNKVKYFSKGYDFAEYTSFSNFTLDASGKDTIQGVDLASNIYGGMFIKYKGLTEVKGTIRGVSRGYASSEKGIAFSTKDGYVDIANLKGIDWTKPYSDIEITIDGGVNNGKGVIEWILNKTITTRDYADKKVLVELGGTSGAVFNFALTKEMFTPSGYLTNCKIESVERLGLTSAMLTLKEPLTDLQKEKITSGQHMNISSSAFVKTYSKIMSGYGRDGVQSDKSYYFVDSLKITKMPTKLEYKVGESFDASGLEVEATMVDGTKNKVSGSKYTVELDTSKDGKSLATVKHMDKIVSFEVNVVKNGASSAGCGSCNSAATAIMSVFAMLGAALFIIKK